MGFSTEISFDIKQTGEKIQGVAQWGLSPSGLGGTGGPVEGTRSGKTIKLQVSSEGFQGELELSGDEMRGSWVGPYPYEIVLRRQK